MSFDPSDYGTPTLWLDPNTGVVVIGGVVSSWTDRVGSLVLNDNGTGGITMQSLAGGLQCLNLQGANAGLISGSPLWTGSGSRTLAVAYRWNASYPGGLPTICGQLLNSLHGCFGLVTYAVSDPYFTAYALDIGGDGALDESVKFAVVTYDQGSGNGVLYLNGHVSGSNSLSGLDTVSHGFSVGADLSYAQGGLRGYLGDVIAFSNVLDSTAATNLMAALAARWAFPAPPASPIDGRLLFTCPQLGA